MGKQIILCVETNKQADTDSTYIMDAIRHNYVIDNSVKISKIKKKKKNHRCSGRFISQDCRQIYRNPKNRGVCEQGCS